MTGTAALVLPRSAGVFDEMGYLNLRPEQTNIFFKLMEERYRQRPTMHWERRSLLPVAQLLVALEEQMRDILMHIHAEPRMRSTWRMAEPCSSPCVLSLPIDAVSAVGVVALATSGDDAAELEPHAKKSLKFLGS